MIIKCGIDLVYLPRFKQSVSRGGENFLRRVFTERELIHFETLHLAGIFAAKEAVMKALSLPTNSWHDIHISYQSNGAPRIQISNFKFQISNSSLSISHDGTYVIAQFVAMIKE